MCLCVPTRTVAEAHRKAAAVKLSSFFLVSGALWLLRCALWTETLWFSVSIVDHGKQQFSELAPPPPWMASFMRALSVNEEPAELRSGPPPLPAAIWHPALRRELLAAQKSGSAAADGDEEQEPQELHQQEQSILYEMNDGNLTTSTPPPSTPLPPMPSPKPHPDEASPPVFTEWTLRAIYFTVPRLSIHRRRVALGGPPSDRWLRMLLSLGGFYDALLDATSATKIILGLSQVAVLPVMLCAALLFVLGLLAALRWAFITPHRLQRSRRRLHEPLLLTQARETSSTTAAAVAAQQQQQQQQPPQLTARLTDVDTSSAEADRHARSSEESSTLPRRNELGEDYVTPTTETSTSSLEGPEWRSCDVAGTRILAGTLGFCSATAAVLCSAGFAIWSVRSVDDGSKIVVGIGRIIGNQATDWLARHAEVSLGPGIVQYLTATVMLYVVAVTNMYLELAVKPYEIYD